jgi:mono/diheme cytochrome c family protein
MKLLVLCGVTGTTALLLAPFAAAQPELPAAAARVVDYDQDVKPILETHCYKCHSAEKVKSGLRLDIRDLALKGGAEGVAMIPGDSANSSLIHMVVGANPDLIMPPKGDPLTPEQVGILRAWIDQGVQWGAEVTPAAEPAEMPASEAHPALGAVLGLDGWKVEATSQDGPLATWEMPQDLKGPDGEAVVALTKANHSADTTFNLLWNDQQPLKDGSLQVRVKAIAGEVDQGGGLIWRAKDKDNYYVCRYNPLEKNLRLYKVVDGQRQQLASADKELPVGEWATLKVDLAGESIKVSLNGEQLIDVSDATFTEAGGVGYWTKADAATAFAGFTAEATS